MSRGFLMGAGWGALVSGFGLVVASQVSDMAPARFETVPPAVVVANMPEAPQPQAEPSAADVAVEGPAAPVDEAAPTTEADMVADAIPEVSPETPQVSAADLPQVEAEAADAPVLPTQADAPSASAVPDAPSTDSVAEQPATDTQSAAPPDVQSAMAAPDAPAGADTRAAAADIAPPALATDATAPAIVDGAADLPQSGMTDAPPETDMPPAAPVADGPVDTAPDNIATENEAAPEAATDTGLGQGDASATTSPADENTSQRPAPGFASKSVDGVKTGRLPSIGTTPEPPLDAVQDPAPEVVLVDDPDAPAIDLFAAPFENPDNKPLFAILLQDTGGPDIDREALAALPFPVSFVIDPTQPDAAIAAQIYRAANKEVLMLATGIPAGATASDLAVSMEVTTAVLPEAVGVVDLEDGGFQGNRTLATQVLALIRDQGRGVMSWDKGLNAASQVARREGMRNAVIFRSLDNDGEGSPLIRRYLDRAAFKAAQDGRVVVAGKTRPETVAAVLEWAVEGRAATVALAPSTAVMTAQ